MYQPEPLSWKDERDMSRFALPPHVGHLFSGASLNFCMASNSLLHFKHLYS